MKVRRKWGGKRGLGPSMVAVKASIDLLIEETEGGHMNSI